MTYRELIFIASYIACIFEGITRHPANFTIKTRSAIIEVSSEISSKFSMYDHQ